MGMMSRANDTGRSSAGHVPTLQTTITANDANINACRIVLIVRPPMIDEEMYGEAAE
jgi:hypothetical protein